MIETIREERCLAFAGAGVSRPLGYPLWTTLLDRLAAETRDKCGENIVDYSGRPATVTGVTAIPDLLIRAEIFKHNLGDRYWRILEDEFSPRAGISEAVKDLARIPFQHILTSNYDGALEMTYEAIQLDHKSICLCDPSARTFVAKLFDMQYSRTIVHVHGRYDDPKTIVLTESEYGTLYENPVVKKFWDVVPMYRRCVFFGFSFMDVEITEPFTLRSFHRAVRGGSQMLHFALLPYIGNTDGNNDTTEPALRMEYTTKYGIEPIFFDPVDSSYSGYSSVLTEMLAILKPSAKFTFYSQVPPPTAQIVVSSPLRSDDPATLSAEVERLKDLTRLNLKRDATGELG